MNTSVAKVNGMARYLVNRDDILEIGKALNFNAEVLKQLIDEVNRLERRIKELEEGNKNVNSKNR